jgi:hypothetical protein
MSTKSRRPDKTIAEVLASVPVPPAIAAAEADLRQRAADLQAKLMVARTHVNPETPVSPAGVSV